MVTFIGKFWNSRQHFFVQFKDTARALWTRRSSPTNWMREDWHLFCIILELPRMKHKLFRTASFWEDATVNGSYKKMMTK